MRVSLLFLCATGASAQCPAWDLPWGSYAGELNADNNIRFASPPTGNLRFNAPQYPPASGLPPSPAANVSCYQMAETSCLASAPLPGSGPSCFGEPYATQTEDCLFLDVYVPRAVFAAKQPVPVAVWLHGGGYLFGSKTAYDPTVLPFYDGTGFVDAAADGLGQPLIFVAGNYRLGAFGWLAGEYFESHGGQANAGLLDQRAILQFVQDHIGEVYGDKNSVSLWGESAGASSIMHHIAMPANIANPLFKRAIVMSPAFEWMWDQKYTLNDTFTQFFQNVSYFDGPDSPSICSPGQKPLDCLRNNPKVTSDILNQTNQKLFQEAACKGILPLGPSVDGEYVTTLAPISYSNGDIAQNIDSIIITHVGNEVPYTKSQDAFSFIPSNVRQDNSEESFDAFLQAFFQGPPENPDQYASLWGAIKTQYPLSSYGDQINRTRAIVTDSSFTCNTRFMIDAFLQTGRTAVYAENYAVLADSDQDVHGSDLFPAFQNDQVDYYKFFKCSTKSMIKAWFAKKAIQSHVGPPMQQYFASHARTGSPNGGGPKHTWYQAAANRTCAAGSQFGTCVTNVMQPDGWGWAANAEEDPQTSEYTCDFWLKMAFETMRLYTGADVKDKPRPIAIPVEHGEQKILRDEL